LEHPEADGLRIARIDASKRRLDATARVGEVTLLTELHLPAARKVALGGVDLSLQVVGLEQGFALPNPENIERDAQRDDAEPRIDTRVLPLELVEALHDARVRLRERALGEGIGAEAGQENGPEKRGPVPAQDLTERGTVAGVGTLAEHPFGVE